MARQRTVEAEIEAPPEADRLEGWPHPRETLEVRGHAAAEAVIAEAIGSDRMHHAWLMTGEQGIGKAAFAYRAARFLLAQEHDKLPLGVRSLDTEEGSRMARQVANRSHPVGVRSLDTEEGSRMARQVANRSHPGLLTIKRGWDTAGKKSRQSIAIDDIRQLRHFLQRTAVTPWRVVIVDSADDLNLNSANALLKSLEEPPARTVFFLISSSPGRLLPTIRSRCRTIRFEPLPDTALREAVLAACRTVEREAPDDAQLATLLSVAKGSPRRVLQFLDGGGLALYDAIVTLLESLPRVDRAALHKLIALTAQRDGIAYAVAFDLLEETIAGILRARAAGIAVDQEFPRLRHFSALIAPDSLADWAELWETIRDARGEAERLNLDKAALTLTVFEKLESLSRKGSRT